MRKLLAFVAVLMAVLMVGSCSATQNQLNDLSINESESQVLTQSSEMSSYAESAPATGISLLSDEELEEIAEDIIEEWNYFLNDGICCEFEYGDYDFLNQYIDEEEQERYRIEKEYSIAGVEKITCCRTKEEVKEHLTKHLDLTSIFLSLPSGFDNYLEEQDINYRIDNFVFEHEGELYHAYDTSGVDAYEFDNMIIERIDDKTFSATVDRYGGDGDYAFTYEFLIQNNGDNYVLVDIKKVS